MKRNIVILYNIYIHIICLLYYHNSSDEHKYRDGYTTKKSDGREENAFVLLVCYGE